MASINNNATLPYGVNKVAMSSSSSGSTLVRTINEINAIETRTRKRQKFDINRREQLILPDEQSLELEDFDMDTSVVGKAWKLVQNIIELEKSESTIFSTIAQDDMVLLAERLIKAQQDYALLGMPTHIDIAYHYTKAENLRTIRTGGLMSKSERLASNIHSQFNGSVYGDGIYCASHPTAFAGQKYGEIGIMVARLEGITAASPARFDGTINTIVVRGGNVSQEFTVLEEARQCLPMFQFQLRGALGGIRYARACDSHEAQGELKNISAFQEKVQALLDKHLNGGATTSPAVRWHLPRTTPPPKRRRALNLAPPPPPPPPGHGSHIGASKPPAQATPASWNHLLGTVPAPTPLSQIVSPANHATNLAACIRLAQATPPQQQQVASGSKIEIHYQSPDSLSSGVQVTPTEQQCLQQQQIGQPRSPADRAALEREIRRQKEKFLMFTRVLLKYLEQKDPNMHQGAKDVVKDCAERNKRQEPGYESVTGAMGERLKKLVGDAYWKRAELYLKHFLDQKKQQAQVGISNSQQEKPESASTCSYHMRPLLTGTELSQSCPICMNSYFQGKIVQLKACGHCFHRDCIDAALRHSPLCPTCRIPTREPRGKMPSGTMTVERGSRPCAGSEGFGSITIGYSIPAGIQKEYHPNPKQSHGSAYRTAYLPNTVEGNQLLKRLKYAFEHGLTFTVGTSLTTGVSNAVTWSSIHHKTNLRGGVHGFPDPSYFMNCNAELDNLHVPPADRL